MNPKERSKMEANVLFLVFTCLVGAYAFVFGFLRKVNEWFYVGRLGEMRHHLPPGDMGWPFVGKTLSFLRAFKSKDPDSFMSSFVTRFSFPQPIHVFVQCKTK